MFTTKPRPVPSKAALRVLYQLAYISSGTAVGVGVLCAEERRRRTQIVQRIADNAKRIRQHPRYVASAALAVRGADGVGEGDGVEGGGWYGVEEVNKDGRGNRKGRRRFGGSTEGGDGVKGKDLPSVVDQEYGAVTAGKRLSSGKRKRLARARTSESRPATLEPKVPKAKGSVVPRVGKDHYEPAYAAPRQIKHRPPDRGSTGATYSPDQPLWNDLHRKSPEQPDGQRKDSHDNLDSTPTSPQIVSPQAASPQVATPTPTSFARSRSQEWVKPLLQEGRVSEAVNLYVWQMRHKLHGIQVLRLDKRLFDEALEQKLFSRCADLLRLPTEHDRVFSSRCQALILACGLNGEHDVLLDLLFRKDRMPLELGRLRLNEDARVVLAIVCSTDDRLFGRFDQLYRSLTKQSRKIVDKQRCHLLLSVVWRSTRNIDAVLEKLRPMVKHLEEINDIKALRTVDSTMADIYISAGKTNDALDTIARMHATEPSSALCIGLAASAFAKQHAWDPLYQVLKVAESHASFKSTGPGKANHGLHGVVFPYSQQHSATQTWKLVTYLQDRLHYRPSAYINRVILEAFVAKKAISLIPTWLRTLKINGYDFQIDSKSAAQLLGKYYREHRPSHVLTMWLCRNLAHLCPSFDPSDFFALIKQSISYDLGGGFERSAVWQREHAEQRLDRLEDSDGRIPSPGYKHSGQLYFRHPQADRPEAKEDTSQTLPSGPSDNSQPLLDDDTALEDSYTPMSLEGSRQQHSIVDQMSVELLKQEYSTVLKLYECCLDGIGVPIAPLALTLAVRASLKLYGHDKHAQHIIGSAERAGMNVIRALAPVVIHNVQNCDPTDRDGANKLLDTTKRFYEMSDAEGSTHGHSVGVNAANMLITNGRPGLGVNLLRSIGGSETKKKRSVDIVFFTVMVKGYIALNSLGDVLFWAREALTLDVRISPNFVRELNRALKVMKSASRRERMHLAWHVEACRTRRFQQAQEAKLLGKQLVATIARCMREETTVDIDARAELDQELFGATQRDPRKVAAQESAGESDREADHEPDEQGDQLKPAPMARRQRMRQRRKERVAESIRRDPNASSGDARHARRSDDVRWMRQYRAFLRKPIVLEDGSYAPYRYHLPSESAEWRGKERMGREQVRARRERFWDDGEGE